MCDEIFRRHEFDTLKPQFANDIVRTIHFGRDEDVVMLIDHGANVNQLYCIGSEKITLLNWALKKPDLKIAQSLLQKNANLEEALFCEVENSCKTTDKSLSYKNITFLLKNGANINAKIEGLTVLQTAANSYKCTFEIARLLLEAGAYVNVYTHNGSNALTLQILHSTIFKRDVVELLIAAGEQVQTTRIININPAHIRELPPYLYPDAKEPFMLLYLCRKVIRNHMLEVDRINLIFKVQKLSLPTKIKNFLLFDLKW